MAYNILVLEDMDARVEWLRKTFKFSTAIWHETTVKGFQEKFLELQKKRKLQLIILDHDLGGPWFDSKDADEQTGTDAAQWLQSQPRVPTIIWSINAEGSKRMRSYLPWALHRPFVNLSKIQEAIYEIMRGDS